MNISAVIVAKDNPPHIFETISSIKDFVSEIIIIDIGIDQLLKNKLKNSINQLIEFKEEIPYVELIREKAKQYVKNDVVLFLDPDEIFPEKVKETVKKEIKNYDYFSFPRKNIIFGKWIEHSRWWPDYQTRVFKKDKVVWSTEIHKQPKTTGKGLLVPAEEELAILHFNYESLDEYLQKTVRYAKAEAQSSITNHSSYTITETIKKTVSEFISRYFAHDGYKDGMHGFVLAILQMFYPFLVYFYIWEKRKYTDELEEKTLPLIPQQFFKQGLKETNHWLINKKLSNKLSSIKTKIINYLLE